MIRVIKVVEMLWTQILTTVMTCIVADKSTSHAKPHFDVFFTTVLKSKNFFFGQRKAEKGIA